ncbi:MAG: hypothetical protein ACAH80_10025 [Alphaproteobacteria bacterium]
MTDDTPATRLQQLMAKSFDPAYKLTDEEALLDMRAGMYMQMMDAAGPAAVREYLLDCIELCREQSCEPRATIGPAAMAATLHTAEKLMESEKFPEARAGEVMLKLSAVYGLRPQMFEGTQLQVIAEIMERDLDVPALEKSLQRFGFEIKDGAIGAWTGPQPPAPPAPKPPRQLG